MHMHTHRREVLNAVHFRYIKWPAKRASLWLYERNMNARYTFLCCSRHGYVHTFLIDLHRSTYMWPHIACVCAYRLENMWFVLAEKKCERTLSTDATESSCGVRSVVEQSANSFPPTNPHTHTHTKTYVQSACFWVCGCARDVLQHISSMCECKQTNPEFMELWLDCAAIIPSCHMYARVCVVYGPHFRD